MRRRAAFALPAVVALAAAAVAVFLLLPRDGTKGALVVTPNPIDFGTVEWRDAPTITVEIRNRSDREVVIRDPRTDCSCVPVVRGPDSLHLAPGRSTTAEVVLYTPQARPGRLPRKTFTIVSDDPLVPRLQVPILGFVKDYRTVKPREIALGVVDAAAPGSPRTIEVRGENGWKVVVAEATATDPRLLLEVRPAEGGSDVLLRTAKDAAKGPLSAQVRLGLDVTGKDGQTVRYNDTVTVTGELR